MALPTCPNCNSSATYDLAVSGTASVDYERCKDCRHVWTTDKQTHQLLLHITPLTKKPTKT